MSEKMGRQEAVMNVVTWAARAQEQANILLRAERGDVGAYERQFGAGGRCSAAIAMANMWANVAAVLDVDSAPEPAPVASGEEEYEPGQWFRDRDDDLWQLHADGLYHLRGVSRGSPFDEIERNFGPIIPENSTVASGEEECEPGQWFRDRDDDLWQLHADGLYHLRGGCNVCSLEEVQRQYGPLTIAEDPSL